MDRVAAFKSFIAQTPDDPFPRYGLAMEHRNAGRLDEAQAEFDVLMERFPDYLATYLMAGNNLVALDRKHDAAAVFQSGIARCRSAGDAHTRSELEAALASLESVD